jgi:hypothetical protein
VYAVMVKLDGVTSTEPARNKQKGIDICKRKKKLN